MNVHVTEDQRLPLFAPTPDAEDYPLQHLNVLEPYARAIASTAQVPAAMSSHSVLCAAALAAQGIADAELPHGQISPLSLNIITTAKSGARKTRSDKLAMRGVVRREKELASKNKDEKLEWKAEKSIFNSRKREIENSTAPEDEKRRQLLEHALNEPPPPLKPRLTVSDLTTEGLKKKWPYMPASIAITTNEGGTFMNGHSFKSENLASTIATYNQIWDGEPLDNLRAGTELDDDNDKVRGKRGSMHLMMQEGLCEKLLSTEGVKDQGMLARFLIASPKSMQGTRLYTDPNPQDGEKIKEFETTIVRMLRIPLPVEEGTQNELDLPFLTVSDEAKAHWIAFYNNVETQSGPGGSLEAIDTFAAKAAENAVRLAGVFTIVKNCSARVIEYQEMYDAICLMNWYIGEALRISGYKHVDENLKRAADILKWIVDKWGGETTQRDIMNAGPGRLTLAEFTPVLKILEDHGLVTSKKNGKSNIITATK